MFPFVQFSKQPWLGSTLLLGCLVVLSGLHQLPTFSDVAPKDDVTYLSEMEAHLAGKARDVLDRFTSETTTVDLNLELDTAQTVVTTYEPGAEPVLISSQEKSEKMARPDGAVSPDPSATELESGGSGDYSHHVKSQNLALTGTWTESTDVRPKIKTIRCCVTLPKGEDIDHDHLYRCLSYALGMNLERGDLLQIV